MPDIASIANGTVGPLQRASGLGRAPAERAITSEQKMVDHLRRDRVEVSQHATWLQALRELPETRLDRIETVREAIEDGDYVTGEKINHAIDGLLIDILD